MIKVLRIDERLIHGQVANQWSKQLAVTGIVVANDQAATNELIEMSLKMAAPSGVKVAIRTVKDAIELLNDSRAGSMSLFVVVNCPKDALDIVKAVKGIPFLNVGNFGRVGIESANRRQFETSLYANEEEIEVLKEIIATGLPCEYRMLTTDQAKSLESILNRK